jgi:probable F420-dependent oxidoreductase
VRFSIQLPTDRVELGREFVSAEAIAELARAAERAGFDACFVTDHPIPDERWLASGGHHTLDPFVALSFAAAATERIRLQTHVLILAYRNPFLTAKAVATLDVLSGGRVTLGVAAGYLKGEFAALGAAFDERNALTDEAIVTLRRVLSGESVEVQGRHFQARGNRALPRPEQRPCPPLWVGGNSRRAIRRAVEFGDGWLAFRSSPGLARVTRTAPLESLDDLRERLSYLRAHADSVGRRAPLEICFTPPGAEMDTRERSDAARLRRTIDELAEAGVTWLATSLPADSRSEWCERVERFGADLIAR